MKIGFFNLGLMFYFLSTVSYALGIVIKKDKPILLGKIFLLHGLGFNTAFIIQRWVKADYPPFSNMFESLVFFAFSFALLSFIIQFFYKIKIILPFLSLTSCLILGWASLIDESIRPLMPALRSNWLTIHVVTCFLGYAAFAVSFVTAVIYLILDKINSKKHKPGGYGLASDKPRGDGAASDSRSHSQSHKNNLLSLDAITYSSIAFGFPFLALGIITGAVWANIAWGTYWSWDPKETWALITWFIYVIYLHTRLVRGWKGRKSAWLAVLGFVAVIFTYVGVNYLVKGLHSYAS